jgi:hypothetical protein
MRVAGSHVLVLTAVLLAALAFQATAYYTTRYQTLPALDWLEAHALSSQSRLVPPAADLARGLLASAPLLVIRDDVRPYQPVFGPPAIVQRTIGGVRDAAAIELGAPGAFKLETAPIRARLNVIVFYQQQRAIAWSELNARGYDIRDPHSGAPQLRLAGPDSTDGVWLVNPSEAGGVATVSGYRGPVGFELRVTYQRPDADSFEARLDLNARAETAARRIAADWSSWLQRELATTG